MDATITKKTFDTFAISRFSLKASVSYRRSVSTADDLRSPG
jgi:hypothetical protein